MSSRLRIALCVDGRSPHGQRWANGLADRGHEVALIWAEDDLAGTDLSGFRPSITHDAHLRRSQLRRPWCAPIARHTARGLASKLQPDLVHGVYLSVQGWTAHMLGVRPLVLTALGSDVFHLGRSGGSSLAQRTGDVYAVWRTRAAVAAADVVLTDSRALAAALRDNAPATPTRIVRFGVEASQPRPSARLDWRRRLDIDDSAFAILSSRLVRPHYNIDIIIRALPAIRRTLPGAVLILKEQPQFSDPDYRRLCVGLIDELDIGHAVRMIGELDRRQLLELYTAADVYVSVPTTDGTAVSVFEAMAAGVPVVATDVPGIDSAILRRDETALLVPQRDPESLASEIAALGQDAPRRRNLAERGREVVRVHGDFDRELDRAVLLYEELVAARARPHRRSQTASRDT